MMPQERNTHEVLAEVADTLIQILAELRRANSADRTGAVSSVQIEDNPSKDLKVRVTTKQYTGSVLDVDEAIHAHGRVHQLADQHALNGWAETVAALGGKRWADLQSETEAIDGDHLV